MKGYFWDNSNRLEFNTGGYEPPTKDYSHKFCAVHFNDSGMVLLSTADSKQILKRNHPKATIISRHEYLNRGGVL